MASWRAKGYVSDSEDEGNGFDIEAAFRSIHRRVCGSQELTDDNDGRIAEKSVALSNLSSFRRCSDVPSQLLSADVLTSDLSPKTTADKLEASLAKASSLLEEVRAIQASSLSDPPSRSSTLSQSADSSLSDPPGSPISKEVRRGLPSETRETISGVHEEDKSESLSLPVEQDSVNRDGSSAPELSTSTTVRPDLARLTTQTIEKHGLRRSLRARTENQIHPYSLEWDKYLRLCKERGIKPVRLPNVSTPAGNQHADETQASFQDESQNQESHEQESVEQDNLLPIQDLRPQLLIPSSPESPTSRVDNVEKHENGPETTARQPKKSLFGRGRSDIPKSTFTRADQEPIYDLLCSDGEQTARTKHRAKTDTQRESLPSPPQSTAPSLFEGIASNDGEEANASQAVLPTPILLSATRARKRLIIEDDSQDGPVDIMETRIPESGISSSEDEASTPEAMRTMQKRVRGVLPASWYSVSRAQKDLDAKQRRDAGRLRLESNEQYGVAQRRKQPRAQADVSRDHQFYQDLVSDDEGDVVNQGRQDFHIDLLHIYDNASARPVVGDNVLQAEEVFDDNGFDPMLPRRERAGPVARKHQTNLHRFERSMPSHRPRTSEQTSVLAGVKPPIKRRKRVVQQRLSILDAPGLHQGDRAQQPSFLRVAARKAKHQAGLTHTRSIRKIFQFVEADDTQAILANLKSRTSSVLRSSSGAKRAPKKVQIAQQALDDANVRNPAADALTYRQSSEDHRSVDELTNVTNVELGTIVQCGQPEQHELRLTRLQSLFPRMNRSGQGRLNAGTTKPRAALLEVLQQEPRRRKILPVARGLPAASDSHENTPSLQQTAYSREEPSRHTVVHRSRKQQPVYRHSPQQTVLALYAPDTKKLQLLMSKTGVVVRESLEHEFSMHQPAWFQGSKNGICMANDATQQHFHVFLQVLQSYLPTALQDAETDADTRVFKSFVHRLIPNRSEIGAQGQVGDKRMDMLEYDLLVARNVLDLHICLLNLVPMWAPLPRYLQYKVNFLDAHHQLCTMAIHAWKELFDCHHTYTPILDGLSDWIYVMLAQLLTRWTAAEREVRTEAMSSMQQISEQVIRTVVHANRVQTTKLIMNCLTHLYTALTEPMTDVEHSAFCKADKLIDLLDVASNAPDLDHNVLEKILGSFSALSRKRSLPHDVSEAAALLYGLRNTVSKLTSVKSTIVPALQQAIARAYFVAAANAVKQGQRSWEDFFAPTSSHCLEMFVHEAHLLAIKASFSHMVIDYDPNSYQVDLRVYILPFWIQALIQPIPDQSTGLLTASILNHEKESLSMAQLQSKFSAPDSVSSIEYIMENLSEIQHATVLHVIQVLSDQQSQPEAEWLLGGLDRGDEVRLLSTMFSTMKACWISLHEKPEEQDLYTVLVHAALEQLELYPRADFVLDSWFLNSATFPQPTRNSLEKLLNGTEDLDLSTEQELGEVFFAELKHAMRFDRLSVLQQEILNILLSPAEADDCQLGRHCFFVRQVLPEALHKDHADVGLHCMVFTIPMMLLDNLECYNLATDHTSRQMLLDSTVSLLSSAADAMTTFGEREKDCLFELTRLTLEWYLNNDNSLTQETADVTRKICLAAARSDSSSGVDLLRAVVWAPENKGSLGETWSSSFPSATDTSEDS